MPWAKPQCTFQYILPRLLTALTLSACNSEVTSNASNAPVAAFTLGSLYQMLLKDHQSPQAAGRVRSLQQQSLRSYLAEELATLSNKPFVVDGVLITGVADRIKKNQQATEKLATQFNTVGAYWQATGYKPLATVSEDTFAQTMRSRLASFQHGEDQSGDPARPLALAAEDNIFQPPRSSSLEDGLPEVDIGGGSCPPGFSPVDTASGFTFFYKPKYGELASYLKELNAVINWGPNTTWAGGDLPPGTKELYQVDGRWQDTPPADTQKATGAITKDAARNYVAYRVDAVAPNGIRTRVLDCAIDYSSGRGYAYHFHTASPQ